MGALVHKLKYRHYKTALPLSSGSCRRASALAIPEYAHTIPRRLCSEGRGPIRRGRNADRELSSVQGALPGDGGARARRIAARETAIRTQVVAHVLGGVRARRQGIQPGAFGSKRATGLATPTEDAALGYPIAGVPAHAMGRDHPREETIR